METKTGSNDMPNSKVTPRRAAYNASYEAAQATYQASHSDAQATCLDAQATAAKTCQAAIDDALIARNVTLAAADKDFFAAAAASRAEQKYFAITYDGKKDIFKSGEPDHWSPEHLAEEYAVDSYAACFKLENEGEKNEKLVLIEPMTDADWLDMADGSVISKKEAIDRLAHEGWTDCQTDLSEEVAAAKYAAMTPDQRDRHEMNKEGRLQDARDDWNWANL